MQHKSWPSQLFILSNEVLDAIPPKEVIATAHIMNELGIFKTPYNKFAVMFKGRHFLKADKEGWMKEEGMTVEEADKLIWDADFKLHFDSENPVQFWQRSRHSQSWVQGNMQVDNLFKLSAYVMRALIVVLATRNIVKTTKERKALALGIGAKKAAYRYTTTITLGQLEMPDGSPFPSGATKRPHLRRGHKRNQKFGPGYQFIRPIFVPPVFINRDKEWTPSDLARDHYNVSP